MKTHPCSQQLCSFKCQILSRWCSTYMPSTSRVQHTSSTQSFTYGPFTLRLEQWCACTFYPWLLDAPINSGWGTSPLEISTAWCLAFHVLQIHDSAMWSCSCPKGFYQMCWSSIKSPGFEFICICRWTIKLSGKDTDLYPFRLFSVWAWG